MIYDRHDLISYLLHEESLDKSEIIRLILQAEELKASDIIPELRSVADKKIADALSDEKISSVWITSGTELFDFLLAEPGIEKEAVLNLFSDYLENNTLKLFQSKLIHNADGNLLNFLSSLDLEKAGIKSVSELISYLVEHADENGYTITDVFNLVQKILGDESLEDFIAGFKKFAGGDLYSLLDTLDLSRNGIFTIDDLIKYLIKNAGNYSYTENDVWDIVSEMALSEAGKPDIFDQFSTKTGKTTSLRKPVAFSLITLGALLLIILILIWREKKKKDKNTVNQ